MRVQLKGDNRLGITYEVLNVLVKSGLDIRNMEVTTHFIYMDIPALRKSELEILTTAVKSVPGIHEVSAIDLLPTERRRLQLHAVLSSLPEPVIAIDTNGYITQANEAAQAITKQSEAKLRNASLDTLLHTPLITTLQESGFHITETEAILGGETYLLRAEPITSKEKSDSKISGSVLIFQRPAQLGRAFSALDTRQATRGFDAILGETEIMQNIKGKAERLSKVDAPLLILGETGTGKELFARACHETSSRNRKPFLALNCAALPENLAESELFGYAPGAFTSAVKGGKPGLLELADTGTLFLDEIGELSPYLQAKLLRFLQDGIFRRVGGTKEIKVNVRVISATNRHLEEMVTTGSFREDLYYRLNVLSITLPPLRQRKGDIPLLTRHFITRASKQVNCSPPKVSQELLTSLNNHAWPGNIRQMENTLFRAVSLCDDTELTTEDIDFPDAQSSKIASISSVRFDTVANYKEALETFEKDLFSSLYPHHPSSRKLAKVLAVSHTTVAEKLKKYGIVDTK
ncbi:sigma 54-interacting transcriptional regulator [Kiloniella sp. EL199]|uniref:sigma 54-interacting transcriptional regulator n=1 Tax=Kiloniella sp. EL199 TaxID=2107581 RepID=UPI000EA23C99|nr:sigma 54-interacting transcriptional regulator [Kiloniella sp. EL199]